MESELITSNWQRFKRSCNDHPSDYDSFHIPAVQLNTCAAAGFKINLVELAPIWTETQRNSHAIRSMMTGIKINRVKLGTIWLKTCAADGSEFLLSDWQQFERRRNEHPFNDLYHVISAAVRLQKCADGIKIKSCRVGTGFKGDATNSRTIRWGLLSKLILSNW